MNAVQSAVFLKHNFTNQTNQTYQHVSVTVSSHHQADSKTIKQEKVTATILLRDLWPYKHIM
jgi:hypothetical protein